MKKEKVLGTLKQIIDECGMNEIISVSSKEFEIADYSIIDSEYIDYLGYYGKKLIPVRDIDYINYSLGKDAGNYYSATIFRLRIIFNTDWQLDIEYGEDGRESLLLKTKDYVPVVDQSLVWEKLQEYCDKFVQLDRLLVTLEHLPYIADENLEYAELWIDEAYKYMKENSSVKNNDEIMFCIIHTAYCYFETVGNDDLHFREWIERLVNNNKMYSFINYMHEMVGDIWEEKELIILEKTILTIKQGLEAEKNN